MEYDYDKLRDALIRYYEISKSHNSLAYTNIETVKNASLDELKLLVMKDLIYIVSLKLKNNSHDYSTLLCKVERQI